MIDDTSLSSIDQAIRTRLAELEGTHETIMSVQSNFTNATIRVMLRDAITQRTAEFSISKYELFAVAANGKHLDQILADLVYAAVDSLQQRAPRPISTVGNNTGDEVVQTVKPGSIFVSGGKTYLNTGSKAEPLWAPIGVAVSPATSQCDLEEEIRARVAHLRAKWQIEIPIHVDVEPGTLIGVRLSTTKPDTTFWFTLTRHQLASSDRDKTISARLDTAMTRIKVKIADQMDPIPAHAPSGKNTVAQALVLATGRPPRAMTLDDE